MSFIKGQKYDIWEYTEYGGEFIYYGMTNSLVNEYKEKVCPDFHELGQITNLHQEDGDCYVFAMLPNSHMETIYIFVIDKKRLEGVDSRPPICVIKESKQYDFPQITHEALLCSWETYSKQFRNAFIQVFIDQSKKYNLDGKNREINRFIKGGALTSMVSKTGKIQRNINIGLIKSWYQSAITSTPDITIHNETTSVVEDWCFYRSNDFEQLLDKNQYTQPLPTSYTTSINFALNWKPLIKCCIIKLLVPIGTPVTFLDHSVYTDPSQNDVISDTQAEVVVPAGDIVIIGTYKIDNKIFVVGKLAPWTFEQCSAYIHENLQE